MKNLVCLFLSLTLFGCASVTKEPPVNSQVEATPQDFKGAHWVDLELDSTAEIEQKRGQEKTIFLELGVIPGAIYGSPLNEPKWYFDLYNKNLNPALDISEVEDNLKKYAKELSQFGFSKGMNVAPADTKLVRVSTFGVDLPAKRYLPSGAFINKNADFVILVYFDRPCSITGDADFGDEGIFRHKIEVPSAGLYQVIAKKKNDKLSILTANEITDSLTVKLR